MIISGGDNTTKMNPQNEAGDAEEDTTTTSATGTHIWAKCFFLLLLVAGVAFFFFNKLGRNDTKDYDNIPQVTFDR